MHLRRVRRIAPLSLLMAGASAIAAAQERPLALAVGALVTQDYFAPVDFSVVDTPATVASATAAGAQIPVVVRSDPRAADAAVAEFDTAFRATRADYLEALELEFGTRTIGSPEIDSPRFRSFRSAFQADNPLFPVSHALAQAWSGNTDSESTRMRLAAALQATMAGRLIGDIRPASTVFFVPPDAGDGIRFWSEASPHARVVDHREIISIESAGHTLRQSLDMLDRGVSGFMTGLLRPNVVEDDYLTGLLLQERFSNHVQLRTYRRGEPILRAGTTIHRLAALAMTQLARMGLEPLASDAVPTRDPSYHDPVETPRAVSPASHRWWIALATASGSALALAGFALWWNIRRRRRMATSVQWLDYPAGPPAHGVREALLPHLARELKNRLVRALFAQRQVLLHNEAAASDRVTDLEERLARLQPAIAEKIRGYERRIEALEAEIEEKDQEARDLIRAKLVLARQELDAEIRRQHITWN